LRRADAFRPEVAFGGVPHVQLAVPARLEGRLGESLRSTYVHRQYAVATSVRRSFGSARFFSSAIARSFSP
jgi:hypothetical protein